MLISTSSVSQPQDKSSPGLWFSYSGTGVTGPPSPCSMDSTGISAHGSNRAGRCSRGRSQGLSDCWATEVVGVVVVVSSPSAVPHPDSTTPTATSAAPMAFLFPTPGTTCRAGRRFHVFQVFPGMGEFCRSDGASWGRSSGDVRRRMIADFVLCPASYCSQRASTSGATGIWWTIRSVTGRSWIAVIASHL